MQTPQTIIEVFRKRVASHGNAVAFKFKKGGTWHSKTWNDYRDAVDEMALGLLSFGVKKGERAALVCTTRPEWSYSDLAIFSVGAVTVPIYQSNTPADVTYILKHSGAKVFIAENEYQLAKVEKKGTPLTAGVLIDKPKGNGKNKPREFPVLTLDELRQRGRNAAQALRKEYETLASNLKRDDLATIVYTSGTTGTPKGAMLQHRQFISELSDLGKLFDITPKDSTLSFLPYAHIFGRVEHLAHVWFGWCTHFAESIDAIAQNLTEVHPTLMFSVPRIYEKAYQKILSQVREGSLLKQKLFWWSHRIGRRVSEFRQRQSPIPFALKIQYRIAYALVFSKLNRKFGGRIRFFISGGAPLAREIAGFFHAAGILILEGYGLTETTAAITVNRENHYQFGTVGPALPEVELKISGDGEILIRSEKVFIGYFGDKEATDAAFEGEWFHSGDIGEIDAEGLLKITDRKKDLIVTSGGKNIAPQKIENLLKSHPIISQAIVHGDKRKYLTALLALNPEVMQRIAVQNQIRFGSLAELVSDPFMVNEVSRALSAVNQQLASYEQIKQFRILKRELSIEEGELTPSLKIRRRFCEQKYSPLLNEMYAGNLTGASPK
ncbi:MAG: long-chain fatty acid--CoA ligase [Deltaproteobacteria bacterium]|nr:long-chain fatty acid--CoA ligase [Deltaproteobacteria bacterium]